MFFRKIVYIYTFKKYSWIKLFKNNIFKQFINHLKIN